MAPCTVTGSTQFYDDIALYSEIGRFRRFGAQWAKKIYDDTELVTEKEKAVNMVLTQEPGNSNSTILGCPSERCY